MEQFLSAKLVVASIVFSLIGILMLVFATLVFDRLTPGKLWEDIVEKQNMPLAIVLGSMMLAVGHIIAAAIHG